METKVKFHSNIECDIRIPYLALVAVECLSEAINSMYNLMGCLHGKKKDEEPTSEFVDEVFDYSESNLTDEELDKKIEDALQKARSDCERAKKIIYEFGNKNLEFNVTQFLSGNEDVSNSIGSIYLISPILALIKAAQSFYINERFLSEIGIKSSLYDVSEIMLKVVDLKSSIKYIVSGLDKKTKDLFWGTFKAAEMNEGGGIIIDVLQKRDGNGEDIVRATYEYNNLELFLIDIKKNEKLGSRYWRLMGLDDVLEFVSGRSSHIAVSTPPDSLLKEYTITYRI